MSERTKEERIIQVAECEKAYRDYTYTATTRTEVVELYDVLKAIGHFPFGANVRKPHKFPYAFHLKIKRLYKIFSSLPELHELHPQQMKFFDSLLQDEFLPDSLYENPDFTQILVTAAQDLHTAQENDILEYKITSVYKMNETEKGIFQKQIPGFAIIMTPKSLEPDHIKTYIEIFYSSPEDIKPALELYQLKNSMLHNVEGIEANFFITHITPPPTDDILFMNRKINNLYQKTPFSCRWNQTLRVTTSLNIYMSFFCFPNMGKTHQAEVSASFKTIFEGYKKHNQYCIKTNIAYRKMHQLNVTITNFAYK